MKEIEKRYLAEPSIVDLIKDVVPQRIEDIYIPDNATGHPTLRLRHKGNHYEITKKISQKNQF